METSPTHKKRKASSSVKDLVYLKKHKSEESEESDAINKSKPFEEQYNEFLSQHKSFFETLKHENSVVLVKSSPYQSFGNYVNYYTLRCKHHWDDPRASVIKREWIYNRKCLDIGSNEGILTIILAVRYLPKVIIGCDIDYTLINKAISHIRSLEKNKALIKEIHESNSSDSPRSKKRKELLKKLEKIPKSFTIGLSIPKETLLKNNIEEENKEESKEEIKGDVLKRLIFRQENYIADMDAEEKYDTILCLSTIKWIHLHYGDTGVKALFYKVYKSLNPEGIFVFEPQPWKSYKKKKHLDEVMRKQYKIGRAHV